jgi:hypothetical protein
MLQWHYVFNTNVDKFVEKFYRRAPNYTSFNILLLFAQLLCKSSSGQREISANALAATCRLQPFEIVAHPPGSMASKPSLVFRIRAAKEREKLVPLGRPVEVDFDGLLRISDIEPAAEGFPSIGDDLN